MFYDCLLLRECQACKDDEMGDSAHFALEERTIMAQLMSSYALFHSGASPVAQIGPVTECLTGRKGNGHFVDLVTTEAIPNAEDPWGFINGFSDS